MMRKALPWIYLLLAVLGAVLPWRANLEFIAESGQTFDLQRFITTRTPGSITPCPPIF